MTSLRHPSTWTLRAKLVASVVLLFLAVTVVMATLTSLAARQYLTQQVDDDLMSASERFVGAIDGTQPPGPGSGLRGGPPAGSGNAVLHLVLRDGEVTVGTPAQSLVDVARRRLGARGAGGERDRGSGGQRHAGQRAARPRRPRAH